MRTSTRYLVAAGTAVAIFAVSFGVAKASTEKGITPIDAAIEVPATATASAQVLMPVALGDASGNIPEASPIVGTATVTIAPGDDEPGEEPTGDSTPPDEDFVAEPPASVLEAAAALDSSSGETADIVPAPVASPDPSTGEPSEEGDPASDPCAEGTGTDPAEGCPAGLHATLYSIELDPDLYISAQADPPTAEGSGTISWCSASDTGTIPEGALSIGAFTDEAGTVTVNYWPHLNPSAVRQIVMDQSQLYSEGERAALRRHRTTRAWALQRDRHRPNPGRTHLRALRLHL